MRIGSVGLGVIGFDSGPSGLVFCGLCGLGLGGRVG